MIREIDTFPGIMEGEALYSAVAHYHLWSANDAQSRSHSELFGQRAVRATFDLPGYVAPLAARLSPALGLDAERLAREHTHLSYLTAFMPRADADRAMARLLEGDPSLHLALGVNASVVARPTHLLFCPTCIVEMRERAGRSWWRLDHQLPGVLVCPEHGAVLQRSTVAFASGQFTFEAATPRTCPPEAEPVIPTPGPRLAAQLLEVAVRSAALIGGRARFDGYAEITDHYRGALREADLMITPKQLDVVAFRDAFRAFYRDLGPVFAAVFGKAASDGAWVLEMARKHTQAKHPLQHILFQMFLGRRPRRVPPFGDGPWACPNPEAAHGRGAMTITRVDEKREGHGLVGTFECSCGYAYTMSRGDDGRIRGPRYKCFGPLLDPALVRLVAAGTTLRGTAAELGLHPRAVAAAAQRLGLDAGWKVPANAGARLGRANVKPPRGRRVENPSPARRPGQRRVDWETLDVQTREQVAGAVDAIRRASPVVCLSLRQIERRIGRQENWIYLRRDKLPLTMELVLESRETLKEYQLRRLIDVVSTKIAEGSFLTPSGVVRAASLRWEEWGTKARELIDQASLRLDSPNFIGDRHPPELGKRQRLT